MIGLIAHLVYWNVFGHLNSLPLDTYHKKLLFIQIAQIQADLDNKYAGKKILGVLHMPMLILCIRIIIENIFKNTYSEFFSKEQHEQVRLQHHKNIIQISVKLINDVITNMLDPNLYYSRFSFLESGMDAINLKQEVSYRIFDNVILASKGIAAAEIEK